MANISLIDFETASEEVKQVWTEHEKKGYRITNMKRTLLHSITAFQSLEDGFYSLQERLETFLDKRAVAFFAYAISQEDDCLVCSTYFNNILEQWGIDFETFAFTETEDLLIRVGREIAGRKGYLTEETRAELNEKYDEQQVVEIVSFAVVLIANNFFNNALDVQSELL